MWKPAYLLLGGLLAALLLVGCGDSRSPEDVAQDFYRSFEQHEYSKAKEYACSTLHDELDRWIAEVGDERIAVDLDVTYEKTGDDGNRAWVHATGIRRVGDQRYAVDYELRLDKVDGDWRVCQMRTPVQ